MSPRLALPGIVRTPSRPGPGATSEEVLRALDLAVGRRVRSLAAGDFRSGATGVGTDLARIRPYVPGDDVRQIDWNVTARTFVPHVRVQLPERVLTTWLLLDVSPSMEFGTADRRKADVAEGVAIAIGHLATQRGNRLAVIPFGGSAAPGTSPSSGRGGLLSALVAVRDAQAASDARSDASYVGATSPAEPLRLVARAAPPGGAVVVVSDFRGPRDWVARIRECTARHETIAVEIRDPREDDLSDVGELTLIDGETGRELLVDTSSARLRAAFRAAAEAERAELAHELRRARVRHVVLSTTGDWLRALAGQLAPRTAA